MGHVFISYAHEDAETAEQLEQVLKADGTPYWRDVHGLRGGAYFAEEIATAIRDCDVFMVILSEHSVRSKWVRKELEVAAHYERQVLPAFLGEVDVPPGMIMHIAGIQSLSLDPSHWQASVKYVTQLVQVARSRSAPAPADQPPPDLSFEDEENPEGAEPREGEIRPHVLADATRRVGAFLRQYWAPVAALAIALVAIIAVPRYLATDEAAQTPSAPVITDTPDPEKPETSEGQTSAPSPNAPAQAGGDEPARGPTIEITLAEGATQTLRDVYLLYPGTYGPSSTYEGIRVKEGGVGVLLPWASIATCSVKSWKQETPVDNDERQKELFHHSLEVELVDGNRTTVEMVEDWTMAYMGGGRPGLLHGRTALGEGSVPLDEVDSFKVISLPSDQERQPSGQQTDHETEVNTGSSTSLPEPSPERPWERPDKELGDGIISPDGGPMVWVPAGTFTMGGDGHSVDSTPAHEVEMTHGFWIGRYEVTDEQFLSFLREHPENEDDEGNKLVHLAGSHSEYITQDLETKSYHVDAERA